MKTGGECPICWKTLPLRIVSPCGHAVCQPCLERQMLFDARCALCRSVMSGVRRASDHPRVVTIRADEKTGEYGVVLTIVDGLVSISSLRHGSAKGAGLQVNDVLQSINGLPCREVKTTIQVLHGARDAKEDVVVEISRQSTKKRFFYRCWPAD